MPMSALELAARLQRTSSHPHNPEESLEYICMLVGPQESPFFRQPPLKPCAYIALIQLKVTAVFEKRSAPHGHSTAHGEEQRTPA